LLRLMEISTVNTSLLAIFITYFYRLSMLIGILCALGAGLVWGLVFIVPLLLGDYPGIVLSLGRYAAFGAIAVLVALFDRRALRQLSRRDWIVALKLSVVGNLLYYAALASAVQLADAPLPTMIIGTLPVVISIYANWLAEKGATSVPWLRLAMPLTIMLGGLLLVNSSELAHMQTNSASAHGKADYALGCGLTVAAVLAWTWYPVSNARHLQAHPALKASTWATAQGLTILPVSLLGFCLYGAAHGANGFAFPLGPTPTLFIGVMLATGLLASWIGTLLWNHASHRLPTSLAGQLIVFETLAALAYAFWWRHSAPPKMVLAGAACLIVGVLLGIRAFRPRLAPKAALSSCMNGSP
jgi:drug/metabolite transporter (DMT)-like permease